MIKIKREDNIFETLDEKQKTFNRIRYGIPMAHMFPNENLYLYLVFDQNEQEENFISDYKAIVLERYDWDESF